MAPLSRWSYWYLTRPWWPFRIQTRDDLTTEFFWVWPGKLYATRQMYRFGDDYEVRTYRQWGPMTHALTQPEFHTHAEAAAWLDAMK